MQIPIPGRGYWGAACLGCGLSLVALGAALLAAALELGYRLGLPGR